MKAHPFSYACWPVLTNTPWFPPDPACLNAWRDEFFMVPGVAHYQFWLCGAAMENFPSNDVDIIVTGEIRDYKELEMILIAAMQLGFKYRQLIDIAWNNYYYKYLQKGRCERRSICCEHYYHHGWCRLEDCVAPVEDIPSLVIGNEIIKNNKIITPFDPRALRIEENLWQIKIKSPSDKQIKRLREGRVYRFSPVLITPELDFKDHISWP